MLPGSTLAARRGPPRTPKPEAITETYLVRAKVKPPKTIDWSNSFSVPLGARKPGNLTAVAVPRAYDIVEGEKVLPPIRPNAGIKDQFQKRLLKLVRAMHKSTIYWISAAYNANEPEISNLADDALPANALNKMTRELKRRWKKKFNEGASELAKYFAAGVGDRTDAQLTKILKDAGFSVEFKLTKAQRDVMKATVHESVSLIKSIPDQYFKNVEGAVMRSVSTGRDLETLTKNLQKNYGVEKRRADFISRDQVNKATAALNRGRQVELGIEQAIWQHSSAGKQPRLSHVSAGRRGQKYNVVDGWLDPDVGEYIWPGTLPNCRCTARSVMPKGFI